MMEMILSIIAILVSIISFICTFYQANKHNTMKNIFINYFRGVSP